MEKVIKAPCIVGDTIYIVYDHNYYEAYEVNAVKMELVDKTNKPYWSIEVNTGIGRLFIENNDINKRAFFNREDAKLAAEKW